MHKGIILLVKAEDKDDARSNVESFLEEYQNQVWDWYQIGGRWTNTLIDSKTYNNWAKKVLEEKQNELHPDSKGGVYQSTVEAVQEKLQSKWEEVGFEGQNPYYNHYNLPKEGNPYDVMKLEDCIDIVNKWKQDYIEAGKKELVEAHKWLDGSENGGHGKGEDYRMYGYSLKNAGKLFSQDFCFDCNVYNTKEYDYSIPEDKNGWYAVIIDIHS